MTYKTKEEARKAANKVKKTMRSPKSWKVDVWEAFGGFNFRLYQGPLSLFDDHDGTGYCCQVKGESELNCMKSKYPQVAVAKLLSNVITDLKKRLKELEGIK